MTDREQGKKIGMDIIEAAESYLLEFIRAARNDGASAALDQRRERLFEAIGVAVDAVDEAKANRK